MNQHSLFTESSAEEISLFGFGRLRYIPNFIANDHADALFRCFSDELLWTQPDIVLFGKQQKIPRLQAWYGDTGKAMVYSGVRFEPITWHSQLAGLKKTIEKQSGQVFNSVLANLYRNGSDSVSWHADDEPELGVNPIIASLSLGQSRRFLFKPKRARLPDGSDKRVALNLAHGDLMIMSGETQKHWLHCIPKEPAVRSSRINLTFRSIL